MSDFAIDRRVPIGEFLRPTTNAHTPNFRTVNSGHEFESAIRRQSAISTG
jgi:hypothetical protein